ncbi:WD repeat-containing protein 66 [Harpegnathos saltator]|uniref:WD repeat-containing protein 66 n=1 Tax=Harpegnathos saltator TaxID=610380 RepID=E2BEC2_HARSA|nr:WD repeat-containing protein 66 [Harpegnathos saltator]
MVFATDKEIGLQLLPLDGNPYKIHSMTGHSQKIVDISVSSNKEIMFTIGHNDSCVLMWEINLKSINTMAQLGGRGISPFYCLIEGGKKGWLMSEMKDLFYYAQILHQGENTTVARVITDTVTVEKIPNLMRAIGYYPSNKEIENIMKEICYKYYAETGKLHEAVTFEEFVRLYVNHRPAFGLTIDHMKEIFSTFTEEDSVNVEESSLTREQFVDILFGRITSKVSFEDQKLVGEPLSFQEAYTYLKLLASFNDKITEIDPLSSLRRSTLFDFNFLPSVTNHSRNLI